MADTLRIAACQLNSQDDVAKNLAAVEARVGEAARLGAEVVVLPENFAFMGGTDEQRRDVAESLVEDGPIVATLRRLAKAHGIHLFAGGMPERTADPMRPHNAHVVVAPSGEIVAAYRKIHLFDVEVGDGQVYKESAGVTPGTDLATADVGGLRFGLSVCYDLRFPELYRGLVDAGADVLLVPAAFTLVTGKDHWHVLLRARAIESQTWVVAAAQWGRHPKGRQTFGKSLVVDPWGDVVAQASEGEGVVVADVSKERVTKTRAALPCLDHRRIGR